MIRHFVALGDSFTEGIGESVAGFDLRSAHDWIALWMQAANPSMRYTNLAIRGLKAAEVRSQQMGRALNLYPDFVSIVAGANDALKGPFSAEAVRAELNLMFGAFHSSGARLFTSTLPNFTLRLPLPEPIKERLKGNLETTNAIIRELAGQYGAIFLEFWNNPLEHQAALWSSDGIHPNARGYLEIANWAAPGLEAQGLQLLAPPPAVGEGKP